MAPAPRIDCRTATRWLSAAFEPGLPGDRRQALQFHLRHCHACATLRDQLQLLRATALPGGTPGADGRPH